nr:hypothetical protein [Tanacetum cinerariifolium]
MRIDLNSWNCFLLQKGVCIDIGITAARLSSYYCQANFWNTASVKRSGDVTRLQALVDKKKIVISEAVIHEILILQLNDAEGMGMLVAIQTADEEVAEAQVQVDAAAAVEAHVAEDVSHDDIPSPLPHRVENLETANAAQKLVIVKLEVRVKKLEKDNKIKSSKLRRLRKVGASRRVESSDNMEDVFNQGRMIADMDMNEGIELVKDAEVAKSEGRNAAEHAKKQAEIYNLDLDHSSKVLISAASITIPAAVQTVSAAYTRRRKGVIIRDPEEELPLKTHAETSKVKDKSKGILVEAPKPLKKKDHIEMDAEYTNKLQEEINKDYERMKKRPQTESEARKNMMIYLKNTAGYKMDFFKGMTYAQICLIFQARFDENIRFLFKSKEKMEEEDQEIIKSLNETPAQKATKRKKLIQLFLLVKRMYPLSRFTLEQLVNVTRLQVEEESEMSLELLRTSTSGIRAIWSRHVTIIHQTKDLHTADYTQLYDSLKYNQKEVDELKAERLARTQDPLALMANSNNPYAFPAPHQDQPSFNQNYIQQAMPNPEDITDPTTTMNMALALMAKAFKLNYSTPTNNNQGISSNPRNRQIAQPGMNMGHDRQMQMVRGNGGNQFRQYAGQNVKNLTRVRNPILNDGGTRSRR